MKKLFFFYLFIQCTVVLSALAQGGGGVKNGMVAPDFTARNQDGLDVSLSQYKGKKVVVYFYPNDSNPGCAKEASNLRDHYKSISKAGYTIICVSTDDQRANNSFKSTYKLPFTFVYDADKSITMSYGGEEYDNTKGKTFVINENGLVVNRIDAVDPKKHSKQVLSYKP